MSEWVLRALGRKMPGWLLLLMLLVTALVRLTMLVASRWWLSWPLMLTALGWWSVGRYGAGTVAGVLLAGVVVVAFGLAYWSTFAPESWQRRLGDPVRSWRRGRFYRARWDDAMGGCGLVRDGIVPTLMSCRTSGGVDRLSVHMAPGQLAADWREIAPRIASGLGVRSVRVRADGPRDVALLVRWREIRLHDPEVLDDAAVDAEVAEVAEQPAEPRGPFPRRPS